jgi:RimJ/RimL family protein N-acetyltransferase
MGADRVTANEPHPLATTARAEVALRPARDADCERVWRWNFDPAVRAVSNRPEIVSLLHHAEWYTRRLAAGGPMWIVEERARPVGVVRIDAEPGGDGGRLSIALGAEARGRGIGRHAVHAACRAWAQLVFAEVKTDNTPSRECFEACGFTRVAEIGGAVIYRWEP